MAWFNEKNPPTAFVTDAHAFLPWRPPVKPMDCFYCREAINFKAPGIYWNGTVTNDDLGGDLDNEAGNIFLHPQCAIELAAHLCKDALLSLSKEYHYGHADERR